MIKFFSDYYSFPLNLAELQAKFSKNFWNFTPIKTRKIFVDLNGRECIVMFREHSQLS